MRERIGSRIVLPVPFGDSLQTFGVEDELANRGRLERTIWIQVRFLQVGN